MLAVTKVTSSEGASEQYVIAGKLQFVSNRRMTDEKLVEEGLKNSSACLPRSMEDIDSLRAQLSLPRKAKAVPIWEVSTICRYDPMIVLEDGMVTFASGTNQDWVMFSWRDKQIMKIAQSNNKNTNKEMSLSFSLYYSIVRLDSDYVS